MANMFEDMDAIEKKRMEKDILVKCLLNREDDTLNTLVSDLSARLVKKYPQRSARFSRVLKEIQGNSDRSCKHAFLLFGIFNDSEWCQYFIEQTLVNPIKYKRFYETALKTTTEKLLDGQLICLKDYIEQLRLEYLIM